MAIEHTNRHGWLADVAEDLKPGVRATLPARFPDTVAEAWELAMRASGVSEDLLVRAAAAKFGLPIAQPGTSSAQALKLVPYAFALKHRVLPLTMRDGVLEIAVCDPTDTDMLDQVRFMAGVSIRPALHSPHRLESAVLQAYGDVVQKDSRASLNLDMVGASEDALDPVVRLARQLLRVSIQRRVSDVHVQPYLGGYLVRIRVDGVLVRLSTLTLDVGTHVIRHFKAVASMDSTDARTPQDGRCAAYFGGSRYDLRLSTVPNAQGERLVIRLLNQSKVFSLEKLGYAPARVQALRRIVQLDSGLILFVGPTGSGKTTSLYALISTLNSMQRSIATIEQPVEYVLPGLSQVEVRPEQGATFASVLRAQLRQDPDVLLIGEIRDEETAEAATRAALTGHLVFSTLHTSEARFAIPRLLDLGVSAPMIGETLMAVASQRLVRKLCTHCASPVVEPLQSPELLFEEITRERPKMRAIGCEACGFTGYWGIAPVVELYLPSAADRASLIGGTPSASIWTADASRGESGNPDDRSMALRVMDMVVSGMTTVEEGAHVMGFNFWSALARHHKHVGWFEGSTSDTALASRSAVETEVLVCSGDETLAAELNQHLSDSGYRVLAMKPGTDIPAFMAQHPNLGLLVVDLVGDDQALMVALNAVRQSFAWSGLPAILMVPPEATNLIELLQKQLANRLVVKPASPESIAQTIRSLTWGDE